MLVSKLAREVFICTGEVSIILLVLRFRSVLSGPRQFPGICRVELGSVFVLTEVHAESKVILCQLATFDQMVEVVRIANQVDV